MRHLLFAALLTAACLTSADTARAQSQGWPTAGNHELYFCDDAEFLWGMTGDWYYVNETFWKGWVKYNVTDGVGVFWTHTNPDPTYPTAWPNWPVTFAPNANGGSRVISLKFTTPASFMFGQYWTDTGTDATAKINERMDGSLYITIDQWTHVQQNYGTAPTPWGPAWLGYPYYPTHK